MNIQKDLKIKESMFNKAKILWEYFETHNKEYSIEREQKISFIKSLLQNRFLK